MVIFPGWVIDETDGMPSSGAYAHRFGSLLRAYSLVGFTPDRDYRHIEANRLLRQFHGDEVERVIREITWLGGAVVRNPATDLLTINAEFTASVVVARCRETPSGGLRWKIRLDTGLAPQHRFVNPQACKCANPTIRKYTVQKGGLVRPFRWETHPSG